MNPIQSNPGLKFQPSLNQSMSIGSTQGQPSFGDTLLKTIESVEQMNLNAQSKISGSLLDESLTSAEVYSSVKKADLALRAVLQIRNKLLDAYQEIQQMRM